MTKLKEQFYIGQVINDYKVIGFGKDKKGALTIECKCNICSRQKSIRVYDIIRFPGSTTHKYCKKYDHEIGDIINDMKIINIYIDHNHALIYDCECMICGKQKKIYAYEIQSSSEYYTRHEHCDRFLTTRGLARDNPRMYSIWKNMKQRINNPNNKDYKNYGGRGLTTDYNNFNNFYDDLHEEYYKACDILGEQNVSMDRIDNDLGYVKGNIRWTDNITQANNKRMSITSEKIYCFSPTGEIYITDNKAKFATNHGFSPQSICDVLHGRMDYVKGWTFCSVNDPQLLLFTPQNVIEEFYY